MVDLTEGFNLFLVCLLLLISSPFFLTETDLNKNSELLKYSLERPGNVLIITTKYMTHSHSNTIVDNRPETYSIQAIRFDGVWIHRYTQFGAIFMEDHNSPQLYLDTQENFPANISSAVIGPDNEIYFFRDDKFCKRPLYYENQGSDCPQWYDNRQLFNCNSKHIKNLSICIDPRIDGIVSDKNDETGRIKFVSKGAEKWQLVIGPDLITGSIVLK